MIFRIRNIDKFPVCLPEPLKSDIAFFRLFEALVFIIVALSGIDITIVDI